MEFRKTIYYAVALLIILLLITYFTSGLTGFINAIIAWTIIVLSYTILWAVKKALEESRRQHKENMLTLEKEREENRRLRAEDREENRLIRAEDREKSRIIREEERTHELRKYNLNVVHNWAQQAWNLVKEDFPIRYRSELIQIWSTSVNLNLLAIDIKEFGSLFNEDFVQKIKSATTDFNTYVATIVDVSKKSKTETLIDSDINHIEDTRSSSTRSIVDLLSAISGLRARLKL